MNEIRYKNIEKILKDATIYFSKNLNENEKIEDCGKSILFIASIANPKTKIDIADFNLFIERWNQIDTEGFIKGGVSPSTVNINKRYAIDFSDFLLDKTNIGMSFDINDVNKMRGSVANIAGMVKKGMETNINNRGLAFGQVQSGKTTHYSFLINMVFDIGVNNIIILTSDNVNLGSQTHETIEKYVSGYTSNSEPTGVGSLDGSEYRKKIGLLSNKIDLFSREIIREFSTFNKRIIIVRKNSGKLKTLKWILNDKTISNLNEHWLIIDDEADYASIDTTNRKEKEKRTAINGHINDIVNKILPRNSFVQYTATPFANLFMQENRDATLRPEYMQYILPGKDYKGYKKFFLDEDLDMRIIITPSEYSDSSIEIKTKLIERSFILFVIDSLLKKNSPNHNMTINISHKTRDHELIRNILIKFISSLLQDKDKTRKMLEKNMKKYFPDIIQKDKARMIFKGFDFISLFASSANIIVFNSKNENTEKFNKKAYIFIGGFKFGRGIMIKNLTFFYIDRTSKNYDTILQQARWFGYREEIPTILIPAYYKEKFKNVAEATEELVTQIAHHNSNMDTFRAGLRIYKNILPSSRNKLGKPPIELLEKSSYKGYRKNLSSVENIGEIIKNNKLLRAWVDDIISEYGFKQGVNASLGGSLVIRGINKEKIFSILEAVKFVDLNTLFIEKMKEAISSFTVTDFTLVIPSGSSDINNTLTKIGNIKSQRTRKGSAITIGKCIYSSAVGKSTDYKADNRNRDITRERNFNEESLIVIYSAEMPKNSGCDASTFIALEFSGGNEKNKYSSRERYKMVGSEIKDIKSI